MNACVWTPSGLSTLSRSSHHTHLACRGAPGVEPSRLYSLRPPQKLMTVLPPRIFSLTCYYGILLPIPVILKGLIIFSSQALLLPLIIHSFYYSLNHKIQLFWSLALCTVFVQKAPDWIKGPGLILDPVPEKLCAVGRITLELQPPLSHPKVKE